MNLTKSQQLVYDMEKFAGGAISVICGSMLLDGKKSLSELLTAANELFRLNDALRIRICESNGVVSQIVTEHTDPNIKVLHFESKVELDSYAQKFAQIPLDLHGVLCEINVIILPEQYGLLVKLHHIVSDAWTLALMGNQFNALLNGSIPPAYSYTEHVESEHTYVQSNRYVKDRNYFVGQFKKCDEVTYLSETQSHSYAAARRTFVIDAVRTEEITDYAAQSGISAFMLFTAALAAYLNRTKMNAEKFYIGTAVLNRNGAKEKNAAGMFVNTVPMLIELDNSKSFADNMVEIEQSVLAVFRHQRYNYHDMLTDIHNQFGFGEKLYDVILSYQNARIVGSGFETTWYHSGMQNESLQIHIDDRDSEGIFHIHYDYLTDKFSEHDIERLHQHICNLLFDAIQDDAKKIYELDMLTADEKQKLLYDFNDTAIAYPKDKCVHQLFEEQVQKTPDKVAVIACDKTLTYAELNAEANRIAHSLINQGVGIGDVVAFALPRKSSLIAVIIGILKTGAAYLPIDLEYPQDRVNYMLSDSKAKLLLTEESLSTLLSDVYDTNLNIAIPSNCICYCIYTSGSTGAPKGIRIGHRNLSNFCSNVTQNLHIQSLCAGNKLLSTFKACFDAFGVDWAATLTNGLTLVLCSDDTVGDAVKLSVLSNIHQTDIIHATPSVLTMLCKEQAFSEVIFRAKTIIVGAENFSPELYNMLRNSSKARVLNGYGPSEATIGASFGEII